MNNGFHIKDKHCVWTIFIRIVLFCFIINIYKSRTHIEQLSCSFPGLSNHCHCQCVWRNKYLCLLPCSALTCIVTCHDLRPSTCDMSWVTSIDMWQTNLPYHCSYTLKGFTAEVDYNNRHSMTRHLQTKDTPWRGIVRFTQHTLEFMSGFYFVCRSHSVSQPPSDCSISKTYSALRLSQKPTASPTYVQKWTRGNSSRYTSLTDC